MGASVHRFLGGSPGAVFVRLVFLSALVGAALALLGISPGALLRQAMELGRLLLDHGFEALDEVGRWIVAGAVIVVPLWLLTRLVAAR